MKIINALPKFGAILFFIIAVASCDEDFNSIGTDIIGDGSLLSELKDDNTVIAYSRKLDPVQTNFLPTNQMGLYNDPVLGKSVVNYVSQLALTQTDPTFGDTLGQPIELESVILYLPYISKATIEEEETTYTLDSVFGNSPVKISIFESNYYLRNLDPNTNFEDAQLYYSNQGTEIESNLGELWTTIEDFTPDDEGYIIIEEEGTDDETETLIAPGIRVELPLEYFQEKIFDKEGDPVLSNNNNFQDYLRGIYFKIEGITDDGSLFLFNQGGADITMNYTFEREIEDAEGVITVETVEKEYVLKFGGIDVSLYDNELPSDIESALNNPNTTQGEETLYIRGGDGILTVIDLFGDDNDDNGVADELEQLREDKWIINDASLIFYVDQNKVQGGETEPERITIYNLETNSVLVDYFLDTTSGDETLDALSVHLGRLQRDSDGNGDYYKIRITNHLSNVINKDSTNVSLGVIASQNVLMNGFQVVDSLTNPAGELPRIKKVPRPSVISPEGTVLYGNNTPNEERRLKLQIHYTDPNN